MNASQNKGLCSFLLFIKYISYNYGDSDDLAPSVTIPPWANFKDMVALKDKNDLPQE
jgi:type I restriction enzyme M protein